MIPFVVGALSLPGASESEMVDSSPACPMRARDATRVVCRNPGGPWVSASIHESARWRHQREVLPVTIGYICQGASTDGPGGSSVEVSPKTVASRYGPCKAVDLLCSTRRATE
jgi:hypothetical protein